MRYLPIFLVGVLVSCSQKIYVVRHAEKAVPNDGGEAMIDVRNPPLSEAGKTRAIELGKELKRKKIEHIYSTKYTRTISTAQPLADDIGIPIQVYSPSMDSVAPFAQRVLAIPKGNILIVGHSNTVDDIVAALTGEKHIPGDLDERIYDNLYIISKKKGKLIFENKKFGAATNF